MLYDQMPTLCLTLPQAARLLGTPRETVLRVLEELNSRSVLRCTSSGVWIRRDWRL